ncbi:unnamed protein product [Dracunculus medinensis]|uniref:WD_REPEATS_REGION domain-containing protein n=1 Tax=Dracunculus medinensis TaxID=318479 RepID=A0A0N4URF4_DRAME|nr:unnamed protein product [Dracunculus medinensis]
MGVTKDYLRYNLSGTCNIIASTNGVLVAITDSICAVAACENVYFYNLRTCEKKIYFQFGLKTWMISKCDLNMIHLFYSFFYFIHYILIGFSDKCEFITFSGHKTGVNCLAFSPDELVLASGGKDSRIVLWDIVNECGLCRLNGHKGCITNLQFTQNGHFLISSSKDTFIKFWNLHTENCFYTLTDSRSEVYTFALLKNDTLLLVGTAELEIRIFQLRWFAECETYDEDLNSIDRNTEESWSDVDGQANVIFYIVCHTLRYVRCKKLGHLFRQAKGRAVQIAFSADERIFTCLGASNVVDIYRIYSDDERRKRISKKLRRAKKRACERGETDTLAENDVAKDITTIISRIGDYRSNSKFFALQANNALNFVVATANFKSNKIEHSILSNLDKLGHRYDIRCLAMAENDFGFASGSSECAIVWNRYSLKIINMLEDDAMKEVTAILFVTGDKHLITGTAVSSGSLFLFDLATNEALDFRKKAHSGVIWQLSPTPDKKGFISCSADKKLIYWSYELVKDMFKNVLSFQSRRILELPDEALCLAASTDSRLISVGLLDNTARIYFVDTFKFFISLYGHSLPVTTIHISSDCKLVITGGADKTVKIWGLDFGDCHKSLFAHNDIVTCVQFVPNEHLFWSAGKDGLLKQWDADKFEQIQVLSLHSAEIRAITQTNSGRYLISASHDKSVRMWELSEEILNLQEEQEIEREKEYEKRLIEVEDIVPGEERIVEADLAAQKSIHSIASAEKIINAVEIVRKEMAAKGDNPYEQHNSLVQYMNSSSFDFFILDIIQKIPSSHLEKSLLMVPYKFVPDILHALGTCISKYYRVELASRVLMFLIKIHHNFIINSSELLPTIDVLRKSVPLALEHLKDVCGYNFAALRLFKKQIEARTETNFFADVSEISTKENRKIKKKTAV